MDEEDTYMYTRGEKYKKKISNMCHPTGFPQIITKEIQNKMILNINKFKDIKYDDQRMYATTNYDESVKDIFIRSTLFHILCEDKFIYEPDEIIAEFSKYEGEYNRYDSK